MVKVIKKTSGSSAKNSRAPQTTRRSQAAAPPQAFDVLKIATGKYARYSGHGTISVAVSRNGRIWDVAQPVLEPRQSHFDETPLIPLAPALVIPEGILLFYYISSPLALGAAVFDKKDPAKLISRSERAFWSTEDSLTPAKIERLKDHVVLVFQTTEGTDIKTVIPLRYILSTQKNVSEIVRRSSDFVRHKKNPIISPRSENSWESQATFNPAALHLNKKVHILYRAVGDNGVSVVGYASSNNATDIDERLAYPVYVPESHFDTPKFDPGVERFPSASGGGFGGCEDPRLTEVEGHIYMTYTAFDGAHPPGVALTSISVDDFLHQRWIWKKPKLISARGEQHKNWVIFPKKINGKFAVLHGISPNIMIDYFDDLNFDDNAFIKSRHAPKGATNRWDNQPRGVGSPPVETPAGWLVLYHAMDVRDPNRYKVGALLLDRNDPTKVLHRSSGPVLEPDQAYENEGYKSGVVYACGAVVVGDMLHVYYGGADTITCVASYHLDEFLREMKKS